MNSPQGSPQPGKPASKDPQQKIQHADGVFNSCDLFQDRTEITICHNGECYRLRQTRSGKLILNK